MKKYVVKMLVMIMAIGGSILISTNVAQARPVVTVSVVIQKLYHYQLKATYPERCDQMVLSYDVAYRIGNKVKPHHVRDAATVILINGNTLLF